MQIEITEYEKHLLQGVIDAELKSIRTLVSRMAQDDPFRASLKSNIEYFEGLSAKLGA